MVSLGKRSEANGSQAQQAVAFWLMFGWASSRRFCQKFMPAAATKRCHRGSDRSTSRLNSWAFRKKTASATAGLWAWSRSMASYICHSGFQGQHRSQLQGFEALLLQVNDKFFLLANLRALLYNYLY